ncbi:MAG: TetR/AcrR family transcriptional regulator [Oscillospiraceae bacterium]|nr:TetR/AcrR family transcriptional regulator [Oscillospiraceae bacterium]
MPTEIFFRLTPVKQQHIIDAVKAEITRAPFEEFSIYNVVRASGISRGSFYQYFVNKEDILIFLLSSYNKSVLEKVMQSLKENDGDWFTALEESYRFVVRMLCYKEPKDYRQHLFCNADFYEKLWRDHDFSVDKYPVLMDALSLINLEKLRVDNVEELKTLIEICMASVTRECITLLLTNADEYTACESFERKLSLMRKNFQK